MVKFKCRSACCKWEETIIIFWYEKKKGCLKGLWMVCIEMWLISHAWKVWNSPNFFVQLHLLRQTPNVYYANVYQFETSFHITAIVLSPLASQWKIYNVKYRNRDRSSSSREADRKFWNWKLFFATSILHIYTRRIYAME